MNERSTFVNALIGAVVTVVTSFVPFSPVLGGAVAGYLERERGLRVGAISGALASLPLALFVLVMAVFVPVGMGGALRMLAFMLVVVLFAALYVVGLSAVGGWVGVYLATERAAKREQSGAQPTEGAAVEDETSTP